MSDKVIRDQYVSKTADAWHKDVTYTDMENTLNRVQSGPIGQADTLDVVTLNCKNGATIPRDVAAQVNEELKKPFLLPDLPFPQAHDFKSPNPMAKACNAAADKPAKGR